MDKQHEKVLVGVLVSVSAIGFGSIFGSILQNEVKNLPIKISMFRSFAAPPDATSLLNVSTAPSPAPQTVIIGTKSFTFANFILKASTEDILITEINLIHKTSAPNNSTPNLTLYSDSTQLTQIAPLIVSTASSTVVSFGLASPFIVPKGTSKTLTLKGDVVAGLPGQTHSFSCKTINCVIAEVPGQMGERSTVIPTVLESDGPAMTLAATGSFTLSTDSSSPTGPLSVENNAKQVTVLVAQLRAVNEDMDLRSIHFDIAAVNGGELNDEFNQVYLFDGTTQIAVQAPTSSSSITFNLPNGSFRISAGSIGKKLTVKADVSTATADAGQGAAFNVNEDSYGLVGLTSGTIVSTKDTSGVALGSRLTIKNAALLGDVNVDGKINIGDALKIQLHAESIALLTGQGLANADVTGEGKVNGIDALIVAQYAGRVIAKFPKEDGSSLLLGDANQNGVANTGDASVIARYASGQTTLIKGRGLDNADVNGDGKITADDATLVAKVSGSLGKLSFPRTK